MNQKTNPDSTTPEEKISFEEGISKLRALVSEMESGNLGLEEMITSYGEGVKLIKYCEKRLGEAEGKIRELMEKGGQISLKTREGK
ncbi:MAG: exodeoxyribonuclease VII small subunit [Candidatus Cloacimonetes bacterium]|jgi:exodeoxyribonuclease VII small subunit|nr:exodeoxyribonuclease VII small subunit [Candidatus Cloacimonadota bacterium]